MQQDSKEEEVEIEPMEKGGDSSLKENSFGNNHHQKRSLSFQFEAEAFRTAEFGVVGAEQTDESHFDSRHKNALNVKNNDDNETDDDDDDFDAQGKIKFSKDRLYGRDKELQSFHSYFECIRKDPEESSSTASSTVTTTSSSSTSSQVVFLSGYSGSGKTRLVQEAVRQCSIQNPDSAPIYIQGKYEELRTPDPYKGISEALDRWYKGLSIENRQVLKYIREEMEAQVGEDAAILTEVIPRLRKLILFSEEDDDDDDKSSLCDSSSFSSRRRDQNGDGRRNSINKIRLHHVFQVFLKCLCTKEAPLIMFLDDLQWADADSLDLLSAILSNDNTSSSSPSIHHFLFVGAYRSNEVTIDHPLSELITSIEKQRNDNNHRSIHQMELSELVQSDVEAFIGDTLHREAQEVHPLTEAIYSRTLGNVFFTMQALEQLVRENALYYDLISFQWSWVLSPDQLESLLSNEVVEMVKSKIHHLPPKYQRILVMASYTRSTFDANTLLSLVNMEKNEKRITRKMLVKYLDRLVLDGVLLTTESSGHYSFAHDRIREAAMAFVSGHEKETLQLHIGTILLERSQSASCGEDWMLFTALFHLNTLPVSRHRLQNIQDGKLKVARMNLEAANVSMSKAAFENAAEYAEMGIKYLSDDRWEQHPELCQELYIVASQASRLIGKMDRMEYFCICFLKAQEKASIDVKYPVLLTLATGLFLGTDRHEEAKEIILDLLKQLGCKFPRGAGRKPVMATQLIKLLMTKKNRTNAEVDKMDMATDPKCIKIMQLLDKLFDMCYFTGETAMLPLIVFRGMNYTLKYGMSVYSPRLFATACMIFAVVLNDLHSSSQFARYALQMMDKVNHRPTKCGTILMSHIIGLNKVIPISQCISPLRKGYEIGMTSGQVEYGQSCILLGTVFRFQAGRSLKEVDTMCSIYFPTMGEKGLRIFHIFAKRFWSAVLGIMGKSKEPAQIEITENEKHSIPIREAGHAFQRIEAFYLGKYKLAADSSVESGKNFYQGMPGSPVLPMELSSSGVSCAIMARRTKKSEYKKEVKRIQKVLESWNQQCNPNVKHWIALLDAEKAAGKGNNSEAIAKYELSIQLARNGGFLHDAAVGYELWGDFLLECTDDEEGAAHQLNEAIELCVEWGVPEKEQRLREKLNSLNL